eukprot:2386713-Pyramimonas_sp.AAC.1
MPQTIRLLPECSGMTPPSPGRASRSVQEPEREENKELEPSKLWTLLVRNYGRAAGGAGNTNITRKGVHPYMAVPLSADSLALARGGGGSATNEQKLSEHGHGVCAMVCARYKVIRALRRRTAASI